MKSSGKYGLSTRGPCFERTLVQNRQNPLLAAILAALVDTTVEDLVVSHDRYVHFILFRFVSFRLTSNCEVILTESSFHFVMRRIHMRSAQLSGIETVGVIVEELYNTSILAIVEDKINCCHQVASFNFSFF